jgi:hypothetical protein
MLEATLLILLALVLLAGASVVLIHVLTALAHIWEELWKDLTE